MFEILEDLRYDQEEERLYERSDVVSGKSFIDALVNEVIKVVRQLLEECRRDERPRERGSKYKNGGNNHNRNVGRSKERYRNANVGRPYRSGTIPNGNASGPQARMNVEEKTCFRCGRVGHEKTNCRWSTGTCFGLW